MPPIAEDAELVAAAKAGDRRALDRLLRNHYDRVFAVCRHLLGNQADAADAAQNAMISAVRGLARFDGNAAFSTWIYRIATNAALDELRRRSRRPLLIDQRATGDTDLVTERVVDRTAGEAYDTVEDRMLVGPALATIRDDYRAAVVLRDVADLDYAEIAEVLDIPPGTVRSRIARGRAALAGALGTNRPDPDVKDADHD
jgi:RNA polymerase sigma-70 factor (ECF subfamily)